jgi:hypothetical protein
MELNAHQLPPLLAHGLWFHGLKVIRNSETSAPQRSATRSTWTVALRVFMGIPFLGLFTLPQRAMTGANFFHIEE